MRRCQRCRGMSAREDEVGAREYSTRHSVEQ
jgi:hypothetical protein